MKLHQPIFADLSTYNPEGSMAFYQNVFGWTFYRKADYYMAYLGDKEVAGLYETPQKFKQMRMPHFWMTYFRVAHLKESVAKAKALGGIIELDEEVRGFGKIALIRDPEGAGFTIYEGGKLKDTRTTQTKNTLVWNELHVSSADAVLPFYREVFGWKMEQKTAGYHTLTTAAGEHFGDILELTHDIKGKYNYWVCTFGVEELEKTKNKVLQNRGSLINEEPERILLTDDSGEAFFYIKQL
ncbi:MAG: VOC family protein [Flavobacteriaceae bacterium]